MLTSSDCVLSVFVSCLHRAWNVTSIQCHRVERKDKGRDAKESLGTQVSHPWLNTPTWTDRPTESRDGR